MNIRVIAARELSDMQVAKWGSLRRADGAIDSPFFAAGFTRAVAEVRDDVEVAILEQDGQPVGFLPFQRRYDNIGQPVGGPMSDFHGLILRAGEAVDAYQLLEGCGLSAWHFRQLVASQPTFAPCTWFLDKSPCIDTSRGFKAYWNQRRRAGSQTVRKTLQKRRKLEREVGPVRFDLETKDKSVLETMLDWKAAQLESAGQFNPYSLAWTRRLFARLLDLDPPGFSGTMSALYVGDELQAAFYCLRSNGVLHVWLAAYNPKLARYSPGYQLLLRMIQSAHRRGIDRIDLGRGDERFKASFATGAVPVAFGSIDSRPAMRTMRWAWHYSRHWVVTSPLRKPATIPWRLLCRVQNPARYW
jgi:CelD/BcsL family acetyltransferase involved in cellulose biosynthesis